MKQCNGNNNIFFKTPKNINIGSGETFHFLGGQLKFS